MDFGVARDHRSALAAGEVLSRIEAEAGGVAQPAGAHAVPNAFHAMRSVLDDLNPVSIGDGAQGVHVAHQAEQMHGQDGLGAGRDCGLDPGGVEITGFRLDIHEHWRRAGL